MHNLVRRTFIISGVVIGIIVAIPILGFFLPKLVITNGVDKYEGEQRDYAEYAYKGARQLIGRGEYFFTPALRVVSVEPTATISTYGGTEVCDKVYVSDELNLFRPLSQPYLATVQGFTFFGIPSSKLL